MHCRDYTRAEALRAAARAGNGLPAIEAGMPVPAGTGLTRRSVLLRGAGLALSVYGAAKLPWFEDGVAEAAAAPPGPVLVQVFLQGGIDSLTLLAPTADADYRRLRGPLALAEGAGTAATADPRLRWHPAAASLAALDRGGRVAVMPAVGYDHADQSHFVSRHFYEVGALDANARTGWLGRYLDRHGSPSNPLQGLALDYALAPALASARVPVATIDSPANYPLWAQDVWGEVDNALQRAYPALGRAHRRGEPAVRQAADAAYQSGRLKDALKVFEVGDENGDGEPDRDPYGTPVSARYPQADDPFPDRLAALAAMLGRGLPLRCVALTAPGDYDTHSDQAARLPDQIRLTFDALAAFQRDLDARGLGDRVLVHVWSEFGRRAEQNGSGTDHGAAGIGLLLGSRVRPQMLGEFPGLARLDDLGNLRATSDFRALYGALLEQWFGVDAAPIVPDAKRFARPALIR
jgi:uncharacterized protein (DUF1501 family)